MTPRAWLALALAGCPKPPPPTPPPPIPDDVPKPREDGKVAGPKYVVDAAPPPVLPADVPGTGVLAPYVSALRKELDARMAPCAGGPDGAVRSGGGALAKVTLDLAGAVVAKELVRSSGDPAWDACLASALATPLAPPPPAICTDGRYVVELVFR